MGKWTYGSAQSATVGETSVGPLCVCLFVFTTKAQQRESEGCAQASSVDISGSHSSQATFHEIDRSMLRKLKSVEEEERSEKE